MIPTRVIIMNNREQFSQQWQRGVTLIELMIVVVVVSILAAVAYPSYTQSVVRSKRQAAKNLLYTIADRQEQFYQDNKRYAADLSALGYAADNVGVDRNGQMADAGAAERTYVLALVNTTPTGYTVQAVPQLKQALHDTKCMTLTLDNLGQRDQSGAGDNCW